MKSTFEGCLILRAWTFWVLEISILWAHVHWMIWLKKSIHFLLVCMAKASCYIPSPQKWVGHTHAFRRQDQLSVRKSVRIQYSLIKAWYRAWFRDSSRVSALEGSLSTAYWVGRFRLSGTVIIQQVQCPIVPQSWESWWGDIRRRQTISWHVFAGISPDDSRILVTSGTFKYHTPPAVLWVQRHRPVAGTAKRKSYLKLTGITWGTRCENEGSRWAARKWCF